MLSIFELHSVIDEMEQYPRKRKILEDFAVASLLLPRVDKERKDAIEECAVRCCNAHVVTKRQPQGQSLQNQLAKALRDKEEATKRMPWLVTPAALSLDLH